nr:MAG TPA: hypothetical protein [Caudoviricetes sp.]
MSYIIKSPDDLKDPFLCYCVFHRFMEEAGEDYIDYNELIVKPIPFVFWLKGRKEITNEQLEKLLKTKYLEEVLQEEILFPNTYGESAISQSKAYALLAEYVCQISEFRQRVWDSVNDKADGFEDNQFYKDEDGISLACIVDDEDMVETKQYNLNDLKNMTSYEFNKLSYKEQFNAVTKLSIEEVDSIDDTY